ncbi:MAG: glycoside hydrolase family 95 protein, partial [Verrucomicrobia bacterium]
MIRMHADTKIYGHARPHPGPLPRGEGESFAISGENPRLSLPDSLRQTKKRATAVPSPGGEGQGEGGRFIKLFLSLFCLLNSLQASFAESPLKLWYQQPAKNWNEALPVGNGRLGAMIFGGVESERLQLNEDSLWSGAPQDADNPKALEALPEIRKLLFEGKYAEAQKLANRTLVCQGVGSNRGHGGRVAYGSYETLGDLKLAFGEGTNSAIKNYRRELDLETATARVSYERDGVKFEREIFSSHADQVLVVRLTASKRGTLNFLAGLSRPEAGEVSAAGSDGLVMRGQLWTGETNAGVKFT